MPTAPSEPWVESGDQILAALCPHSDKGLTESEATRRRSAFGANELNRTGNRPALLIFAAQFRSIIVLLLATAAGFSFLFQDWVEGSAVIAVILINALIGFFTELNAVRSMEALRTLTLVSVSVKRGGELKRVPASDLVPGDVVVVEGGDLVAADMRLFHASRLQVDESSLTGESVPVAKSLDPLPKETILADRSNMLFKGTSVTRGSGEAVVTATGAASELGRISTLVAEATDETTPLEKRLDNLGRRLVWVTLVIVVLTGVAGIQAGKDVHLMIETSIALAVAAIPEGLPIVATMALARGMWRMARRNALINRLSAVETLGATNVICSDKTGTLTENKMTVVKIALADGVEVDMGAPVENPLLEQALTTAVLCNNASLGGVGDPLEVALLEAAAKLDLNADDPQPRVAEEAFDSETKMMATIHKDGSGFVYHVEGAAESIIDACTALPDAEKHRWLAANEAYAEQGFRVLALARKRSQSPDAPPYEELTFLALVAMIDPPRQDVRAAIDECKAAGIQIVMITGDQAATAAYVADAVGLTQGIDKSQVVLGSEVRHADDLSVHECDSVCRSSVFARVSPGQKLDLIETHQSHDRVVAMTGDGVNDAPALKKADIGIAMGLRGTEVAKEAADVVLKDDAFGTIVHAIEQGRIIFTNIRRFVVYLMSCNLSEILVVALAAAVNSPLPILPLQILFLNMVTDVFPALALGMGEGSKSIMRQKPRPASEPLLRRSDWLRVLTYSVLISASVLTVFATALVGYEASVAQAVSIAFVALAGAQLLHVFNMRERSEDLFSNQITRNHYVWWALIICIGLIAVALYAPPAASVLGLEPLSPLGWKLAAAGILAPLIIGQLATLPRRR